MKNKTLAVLLDADGCFYNKKYAYQLLYVIYYHGDFINAAIAKMNANPRDANLLRDIQVQLERIRYEVSGVKVSENDFNDILQAIANKFFPEKKYAAEDVFHAQIAALRNKFISDLDMIDPKFLDNILCQANKCLIEKIKDSVQQHQASKVIFMVGSNRQSWSTDNVNRMTWGSRSFFSDLEMFRNAMERVLAEDQVKVRVDHFLMSDIYGNLTAGESYQRIMNELNNHLRIHHADVVFDHTKLTIIYGFLHHLAVRHKTKYDNDQLAAEFYDDTPGILHSLISAFDEKSHRSILPEKLLLTLYHYAGDHISRSDGKTITGTGVVDYNYRENIKEIARLCHRSNFNNYAIDAANQLSFTEFQMTRRLFHPDGGFVRASVCPGLFAHVRQNLKPDNPITKLIHKIF